MATIAKISNGASAASALNYALGQDRPMHEKTEQWLQDHQLERPVELTNCRAVAV
ncbi:relaxase, partial [Enterococcus faecalis]